MEFDNVGVEGLEVGSLDAGGGAGEAATQGREGGREGGRVRWKKSG